MNRPYRILFFGTPSFAGPCLEAMLDNDRLEIAAVVTQPDKPRGRGQQPIPSPIKEIALSHHLPVHTPSSLRKEEGKFLSQLEQQGPIDCGVVVAFGQILPPAVLNYPRRGCVNVHASLLPRWRGAAPLQRALMAGDTVTGVCLMAMDQGLDTGAVYARAHHVIPSHQTFGELHDILSQLGAELLASELLPIIDGQRSAVAQPLEGITYAAKVVNEEARIDWSKGAVEIHNHIRGLSPFPGAFTLLSGKRLKILRSSPLERAQPSHHPAGAIVRSDRILTIQCGHHEIEVLELQLEGKKRMTSSEFLRGVSISPGTQLGS